MTNKNRLFKITTAAVMMALTCVLTMAVRIPTPTKGYINLGDCAVLLGAWLLGPVWGGVAGGIGSAFADLFSGYPVYIPGTLIIKTIMALIVALIPRIFKKCENNHFRAGLIIALVIAESFMVAGYCFYEAVVIGIGFLPALAGVSGNIIQGIFGAVGSYFLIEILARTDIIKIYDTEDNEKSQIK